MQCELTGFYEVLKLAKKPTVAQTTTAFVFVTSAFTTHFGIKKWIESKEAKRLDSLQFYIDSLEWVQVVNDDTKPFAEDES